MVKSAIRSRQLAAARNRMMADVPTADVVLVNPTHVAVALRYEPSAARPGWSPGAPARSRRGSVSVAGRGAGPAGARRPARPGALPLHQGRPGDPARAVRRRRPGARVRDQPAHPGPARRRAPDAARRLRSCPPCSLPGGAGPRQVGRPQPLRSSALRPIGIPTPGRRHPPPRTARPLATESRPPMKRVTQLGVPVGIVFIVVMLVVPLPGDPARPADRDQHHRRAADPAHRDVHPPAARLRRLPRGHPGDDAVPARAERERHPARPARRVRRQGDRHLRPLRRRRLAAGRPDRVRDPAGHPVRRDHQRRRPGRRGRAPGSRSTRCPASRWRSTPTSTPA